MGTQKNCQNETILSSVKLLFKSVSLKKIIQFYALNCVSLESDAYSMQV